MGRRTCRPTRIQQFSSNPRETKAERLFPPSFVEYRLQLGPDLLDSALCFVGPEHALGIILWERHCGLDGAGGDRAGNQVYVRSWVRREQKTAATLCARINGVC